MSYTLTISIPDKTLREIMKKENLDMESSTIRRYILKLIEQDLVKE